VARKRKATERKARTPHAQVQRMRLRHPSFRIEVKNDLCIWTGSVTPVQARYRICVIWDFIRQTAPYVSLIEPEIAPPEEGRWEDIPHLWYDEETPQNSGLCLFDPDGKEWDRTMLIADYTIPWACEWIKYYELWHLTGEWLGPSAKGPESVGAARRQAV